MLAKLVKKYFIGFFIFSLVTLLVPSAFITYSNYNQTLKLVENKHENILKAYRHDYVNNILIDDVATLTEFLEQVRSQVNLHQCLIYGETRICTHNKLKGMSSFSYDLRSGEVLLGTIIFHEHLNILTSSNIIFVFIIFILLTIVLFLFYQQFLKKIETQFIGPTNHILENLLSIEKDKILEADVLPLETRQSLLKLIEFNDRKIETELNETVLKKYSQIYHDIKSPLTGLEFSLNELSEKISAKERIEVLTSLKRINDIVNSLTRNDKDISLHQNTMLLMLLKNIVSQKEIEYSNREDISIVVCDNTTAFSLFSMINYVEFERILSNLINNCVEAKSKGRSLSIRLSLSSKNGMNIIEVIDNGEGIKENILPTIFEHGKTTKDTGQGIGLAHAKDYISSLGGNVSIKNNDDAGARVRIELKAALPPAWFCKSILAHEQECFVIIDDDDSIHNLWSKKLSQITTIHHCKNAKSFHELMKKGIDRAVFLFDYELLGELETGIDLIRKYGLENTSYLVTSHYKESTILDETHKLGIRVIPKELAISIPIHFYQYKKAVLIDDDKRIHRIWERSCSKNGIEFLAFFTVNEFFQAEIEQDKTTVIFIDSELGEVKGEIIAEDIYQKGYQELYLATGKPRGSVLLPSSIIEQVGKEFPEFLFR